ncbi:MAG: radical SAM protein [bacterium]
MKVLLIKPPINKISILGDSLIEPLELEILAATIPGHNCRILDMRIDTDLKSTLEEFKPDLVGLTSYTTEVPAVRSLLHGIKSSMPESFTVVGGCHASARPEDFHLPGVDAVAVGNGERIFPALVGKLSKGEDPLEVRGLWGRKGDGFVFTGEADPIKDLNGFPAPNRHLTQGYRHLYYFGSNRPAAAVMTSRGCPFRCSFCSIWRIMQGRYLLRDPGKVAQELSGVREKHVFIADDNTLSHARHAEALFSVIRDSGIRKSYKMYGRADAIVARPDLIEKWRSIGLTTVIMGLESFQDKRLAMFNKKSTVAIQNQAIRILKEHDVRIRAYFIVDPDFSRQDFEDLMAYVHKEGINEPMFSILTPFPGTDFYDEVQEKLVSNRYEFFDLLHALLPTKLRRKEFYRRFSSLYRRSYPLRKILSAQTVPVRAGTFLKCCASYVKFRSVTLRMKNAYKMEEKIHAETRAHQPGIRP